MDRALDSEDYWPAPAKLNLFLHVVGRRDDGYHELQTLFQFLDYCDQLYFRVRNDGVIHRCYTLDGVEAERDLVVKAARSIQRAGGTALGIDIGMDKRIPFGGGLGGGSSDAATTLVALNRLWKLRLSTAELANIGLRLGADVPIFIHGRSAWAEGVGERFSPFEPGQPWYLVVKPNRDVSTAEIFSAPELTRDSPPIKIHDFLCGQSRNDCEAVVKRRYPEVRAVLDWFGSNVGARMTGTGACVFRPYDTEREARAALAGLPRQWSGFVARGVNRSPLLARSQGP